MTVAMDTSVLTQNAMWQAQNAYADGQAARVSAQAKGSSVNMAKAKEAAQQFEGFFVGQMMEYMMAGVKPDPTFGGGQAEETWRSMLNQEYGKQIAKSGRLGIADKVMKSMLEAQERKDAATAKLANPQASAQSSDTAINVALPQASIAAGATAAKASKLDVTT